MPAGLLGIEELGRAEIEAILALARVNALTFPLPNEDDASFFFPAWNLAVHGTLRVPLLNAPDGIFWVPHGFYLWLALFLRAFAPTLEVARTVCQLTTAAAAVLLVVAYARICGSRSGVSLPGSVGPHASFSRGTSVRAAAAATGPRIPGPSPRWSDLIHRDRAQRRIRSAARPDKFVWVAGGSRVNVGCLQEVVLAGRATDVGGPSETSS